MWSHFSVMAVFMIKNVGLFLKMNFYSILFLTLAFGSKAAQPNSNLTWSFPFPVAPWEM